MNIKGIMKHIFYACASYSTLPRALHQLSMRHSLGILMYHGIVEEPLAVPDWCFITAQEFKRQMEYLQKSVRVVSLRQAVKELAAGSIHRPTVALTFDDGYQNNYDVALPILRNLGLPATVFLVTGLVGSDDTLWFCRLNQALAATRRQSLSWNGNEFYLRTQYDRARVSALLQRLLKTLPHDDMLMSVEKILVQLGADPREPIQSASPYRMLDTQAIQTMAESGLIEFGAHTASHVILSRERNRERIRREIIDSIRETERLTGLPCKTFAYPNGSPQDYGPDDVQLLEQMGVDVAVTTISGPNMRDTSVLELRRYGVGVDCTDSEFQCLVHHFDAKRILRIGRGS